ncbi:Multidrug resistance-associated protein 1 [Mortierella claussenii]|nr:Multidrug resistance-associated protein 1 [Mortierella claussenii]
MSLVALLALLDAVLCVKRQDGSPAEALGYLCFGMAWAVAVVLNSDEHRYSIRSSDVIFSFFLLSLVTSLLIHYPSLSDSNATLHNNRIALFTFAGLLVGFVVEAWPRNNTAVQQHSSASAYDKSSLLSRCTFQFFQPIISLSIKRTIVVNDIKNQLPEFMHATPSQAALIQKWEQNKERAIRSNRQPSLFWTIMQVHARPMIPILFFRTVRPLLLFSIPGLLSLFLGYLQDIGTDHEQDPTVGYLLALAIFAAAFIGTIIQAVSRQYSLHLSLQTKVALTSMVYRKALKLSPESRTKSTTGEIMNHMSVDASVWTEGLLYMSMWVSLPIEIITAMWLLYRLLGWSFLAGIVALLLMTPLQIWRARVYNKMQKDRLAIMDERVRLITECLAAIKVVKLYCWQDAFKQKILSVRNRELASLKRLGVLFSIMSIIFTSSTLIICLLTLSVYATWGGEGYSKGKLTPQTVFVSMTLFAMLRTPIASLAEATSNTIAVVVGTERVQKFLLLEEIRSDAQRETTVPRDETVPVVEIREVTFSWTKPDSTLSLGQEGQDQDRDDSMDDTRPLLTDEGQQQNSTSSRAFKPTLQRISLSISRGSLTAIVGRVGQGKSSILSAIIGEMYTMVPPGSELQGPTLCTRGRIAYVPQQAWILNASLRDNILFGQQYDEVRFQQVIHASGLEPDLAMLPAGDLTEIGERGINLSGGQKQRVSLARAAYNDADIYLLDDPLSAVDAHVERHLWKTLIGPNGMLRDKTRVLVTHGIHHLKEVDQVLMMKDGQVESQGTYEGLMKQKGMFYSLIKEYALKKRRDSEGEVGGGAENYDRQAGPIVGPSSALGNVSKSQTENREGFELEFEDDEDDQSSNRTLDAVEDGEDGSTDRALVKKSDTIENDPQKATTAQIGKIITEEKIKEGNVDFGTGLAYVRAASYKYAFVVALCHILAQASLVGTSLWLKYWIKRSEDEESDGNTPSLKLFLSVFSLLTLGYVVMCILMIYFGFAIARIRASLILHQDLISRLIRLPSSFFDTTPLGRTINRISGDMQVIDDTLPWAFDSILMFSISVAASVIIVSVSTPLFLVALPFFVAIILWVQHMYLHASRAIKRIFHVSKSPIYQHFNETLGGLATIRAMQLQNRFISENVARVDAHTNAHVAYTYCVRWMEVRLQCLSAVAILIVAVGFVMSRGSVDPATAGLALSFALNITQDVNLLVKAYCDLQNQLVPVERVCEYIDLPPEAPEILPFPVASNTAGAGARAGGQWPPKEGSITFENFSARYREGLDLVLKNISFEVKSGERVGIVGRTGAGKSTLTLVLFRMIEAADSFWAKASNPSAVEVTGETDVDTHSPGMEHEEPQGRILIDGVDISTLGLVDLRQALAIIPQDPVLFAGSVRDNLDPFLEHSDHLLWEALERAHLKDHIQQLPGGLSFQVAQSGENFSVGQRSLICLARALLRKTKILVLDEATSSVDIETDELIQRTIRQEFGDRTILTIAHRIKTVMDSDKILVLDQGRVVEYERPGVLLQRGQESLFYRLAEQAGEV